MIRLFIALPLPAVLRQRLALMGGVPGASWTQEPNFHVTLRFIGEVDGGTAQDIAEALSDVQAAPFELRFGGLGQFGKGTKSRLLYLAVEPVTPLIQLHDRIESALVRLGLAAEGRKFTPHVTLARLKEVDQFRLAGLIASSGTLAIPPVPADRFVLYSSWQHAGGAIYREEADWRLLAR